MFSLGKPKIFQNFLTAEKTEKFLPISFLEIFKLDFQIPGKILSGILVQHLIWCWNKGFKEGVKVALSHPVGLYFHGTIVLRKYVPTISAVGLFCSNKFEDNQNKKVFNIFPDVIVN